MSCANLYANRTKTGGRKLPDVKHECYAKLSVKSALNFLFLAQNQGVQHEQSHRAFVKGRVSQGQIQVLRWGGGAEIEFFFWGGGEVSVRDVRKLSHHIYLHIYEMSVRSSFGEEY